MVFRRLHDRLPSRSRCELLPAYNVSMVTHFLKLAYHFCAAEDPDKALVLEPRHHVHHLEHAPPSIARDPSLTYQTSESRSPKRNRIPS